MTETPLDRDQVNLAFEILRKNVESTREHPCASALLKGARTPGIVCHPDPRSRLIGARDNFSAVITA